MLEASNAQDVSPPATLNRSLFYLELKDLQNNPIIDLESRLTYTTITS